jgi:hypothetical protein
VGYSASAWLGFGAALAGASGALTGLLFVAVSIKSDLIARSRTLASRAAQTLTLFMISVLTGLLLVAPQPRAALGSELLALALGCGVVLLAGILDLAHAGGGLYWLIPASVSSLVGGVVSAWLFLVKVTE